MTSSRAPFKRIIEFAAMSIALFIGAMFILFYVSHIQCNAFNICAFEALVYRLFNRFSEGLMVSENALNISEIIRNYGLVVAGIIGLMFAWWRADVADSDNIIAQENSEISNRQMKLSEAGHNTDRFQKGAEMLGDARLSVRQAGIFTLQELAKSDPENHYTMVQNTLCAFIRDRSDEQREKAKKEFVGVSAQINSYSIDVDSQSAITAISNLKRMKEDDTTRFNLRSSILCSAELSDANLSYIDFFGSLMVGAELCSANLQETDIRGCDFEFAKLEHTIFNQADVDGCYFSDCVGLTSQQLKRATNADPSLISQLEAKEEIVNK